MRSRIDLTMHMLDWGFGVLADNLKSLTLAEALFAPPDCYRSILGTIKHAAAWSHVYRSYAFDASPVHWRGLAWPQGRRDTVIPSEAYLAEVIDWLKLSHQLWQQDLRRLPDEDLDELRPVHWGATLPLFDIACLIADHHVYHAGEINQLLAIARQESWEEGEEVEENHLSSEGHKVIPPWKR
jgi:DinB superfamily